MTSTTASGPAPQPPLDPTHRLVSLDIFRGACASAVFLTHWFLWANFRPVGEAERLLHDCLDTVYSLFLTLAWNSDGHHPAVLGFFVLSGFCIHASKARRLGSAIVAPDWRRYFLSRAWRILPIYWWGMLLGAGFVCLQVAWPTINPMLAMHAAGDWRDLLLRAFALTAIVPRDVILGNWTLNTVSTEISIYLLYPLLFLGTRRLGWIPVMIVMVALQYVALALVPYTPPNWLVGTPLLMGAYWYVGMLAAEWHFGRSPTLPFWVPFLAWGLFLALREAPPFPAHYVIIQLVRALGFATLLLWLVGRETNSPSFGSSRAGRFMGRVGEVSYSLYAVHTPIIFATTWALSTLLGSRSNTLQLAATMLACLAGTALSYRFIERPFLLAARASRAAATR